MLIAPMSKIMQRVHRPLAFALLIGAAMPATASAWTLDAATWARPRSGAAVLSMSPLPAVVGAWSRRPDDRIVVRHPGGESGELWATELRDWLVALGVPGDHVEVTGGGEPERLVIAVR